MRAQSDNTYVQYVLQGGNRTIPVQRTISNCAMRLPPECLTRDIITAVYGTTFTVQSILQHSMSVILAPKNEHKCDYTNITMIPKMDGESKAYYSVDEVMPKGIGEIMKYPTIFLLTGYVWITSA